MGKLSKRDRIFLKKCGLNDTHLDQADQLGFDWAELIRLILEIGIPLLIAFLESLLKPKPPPA